MSIEEPQIQPFELPNGHPWPPARMTEQEFLDWCDEDVKAEWVDGEVIMMSPAGDQQVSFNGWVISVMLLFCEHFNLGEVRGPELMIRIGKPPRRRVPDVLFIAKARLDILKKNHVEGAPDLVMEIVSPDSEARDWRDKYLEYQAAGVREYWAIDRMTQHMEAYALGSNGQYIRINEIDGKISSSVLPGFYLRPAWCWQEKLPKVVDVLKELRILP